MAIKRSFEVEAVNTTYRRGNSSINPLQEYKNPKGNCCIFVTEKNKLFN